MTGLTLYSYWRSSAAYRVRIALNLKQLPHRIVPVNLINDGGEQHTEAYRALNPQQLVPVLKHGNRSICQSLAIMEYLDETWPEQPLLPSTARERARVRSLAQAVACDIHPLNNLRVLQFFKNDWQVPQAECDDWARHWIRTGFLAIEQWLSENPSTGEFCEGERPGLADCCLVPQVYNAHRFNVAMEAFPTIARINASCLALPAFEAARPERQADAPPGS